MELVDVDFGGYAVGRALQPGAFQTHYSPSTKRRWCDVDGQYPSCRSPAAYRSEWKTRRTCEHRVQGASTRPLRGGGAGAGSAGCQLAQDVLEKAAVLEVLHFLRGQQHHVGLEAR